jgi:hypothetical protein
MDKYQLIRTASLILVCDNDTADHVSDSIIARTGCYH